MRRLVVLAAGVVGAASLSACTPARVSVFTELSESTSRVHVGSAVEGRLFVVASCALFSCEEDSPQIDAAMDVCEVWAHIPNGRGHLGPNVCDIRRVGGRLGVYGVREL